MLRLAGAAPGLGVQPGVARAEAGGVGPDFLTEASGVDQNHHHRIGSWDARRYGVSMAKKNFRTGDGNWVTVEHEGAAITVRWQVGDPSNPITARYSAAFGEALVATIVAALPPAFEPVEDNP